MADQPDGNRLTATGEGMEDLPVGWIWAWREAKIAVLCAALALLALVAARYGFYLPASILAACALGLAFAFYFFAVRPARIPRGAVLMVKLAGALAEEPRRSPLDALLGRGGISLHQVRCALEAARKDPRLSAVVIEIAGLENGLATAEELHDLIGALGVAGKRVIAVLQGEIATAREYLVAAAAQEIVANPGTLIALLGAAAGGVFLRGALDRLKVRVQTLQWKEYKGAAETFGREGMSPAVRESLEALVGDWREALAGRIGSARRLGPARAREAVAAGFLSAHDAREAGLVDREGYVEDLRAEFDPDGKRRRLVGLNRYLRRAAYLRPRGARHRIALVCGSGPVISGPARPAGEFLSGETTAAQIDRAARDRAVRAIVFRVNSPGGSVVGSDLVWRAVRAAQERGKPVVVSMGDVAGSGGYYVAAGADAIVAEPSTITGSIGVVYVKLDLSRALAGLGVNFDTVKSDSVSDALSMTRAMTGDELHQLDQVLGRTYANFTAKVAQGRRLAAEAAEEAARGRVWSGVAAKAHGLVDELGGLSRAVGIARDKAGIPAAEPHELVSYSRMRFGSALRLALGSSGAGVGWELAALALGAPVGWMPAMARLFLQGGVLLLGPIIEL